MEFVFISIGLQRTIHVKYWVPGRMEGQLCSSAFKKVNIALPWYQPNGDVMVVALLWQKQG
jgi:hypothetical protein